MPSILRVHSETWKTHRLDALICAAICGVTLILAFFLQSILSFTNTNIDVWFDSDSVYILDQNTSRFSAHHGSNSYHPIYPLLTFPFVFFANRLLGFEFITGSLIVMTLYSALFIAMMYVVLRLMGKPIPVALIFTGILLVSTPTVLYLGVQERLILGGLTILVFFAVLLLHQRGSLTASWLIPAAALTLGVTVTNFMVAVVALPLALGWKKGIQAIVNAIAVIVLLNPLVQFAFPASAPFLAVRSLPVASSAFSGSEDRLSKAGSLGNKAFAFFFHSMVLPEPAIERKPEGSAVRYLSVQKVKPAFGQITWYLAAATWLALLVAGISCLFRRAGADLSQPRGMSRLLEGRLSDAFPWVLGLSALGQLCLFMLFGAEIVLFSPYYTPIMILIAAMAWQEGAGSWRIGALALLLLCLLAFNNWSVFGHSLTLAHSLIST